MLIPRQNTIEPHIQATLTFHPPTVGLICAFIALTWANAIELNIRIWSFFKVHRGLYFWSLLVASWAAIIYGFGELSNLMSIINIDYINAAIIFPSWSGLITGEALVLYSRLHLVMRNRHRMRWVLYMIIVDAILFHIPTGILHFLAVSPYTATFKPIYTIYEKIEVTAFCLQEMIISAIYIHETYKMLKPGEEFRKTKLRTVLLRLIAINIAIICLDFVIIGTEYANYYEIQTTFKAAVYAIKLRLEFTILNQLMRILDRKADNPGKLLEKMGRDGRDSDRPGTSEGRSRQDAACWSANTTTNNSHTHPPIPAKAAATLMGKLRPDHHHHKDRAEPPPADGNVHHIQMTTESIVSSQRQGSAPQGFPSSGSEDEKGSLKSSEGFHIV